jgi:hypothetical protein
MKYYDDGDLWSAVIEFRTDWIGFDGACYSSSNLD